MQQTTLLHKFMKSSSTIKNGHRLNAVCKVVNSVLDNGKLSVTSLGRHMAGKAKVKNKIKTADRLLSNGQLLSESHSIYSYLSQYITKGVEQLMILIDWSPIGTHAYHLLRASVYSHGRSMTIYQELHEEKYLGNSKVQKQFLEKIKQIFPTQYLIIITDAGFKTDFFKQVVALGMDFIGRIRSNMKYKIEGTRNWFDCVDLYAKGNSTAKYIGAVKLAKSNQISCQLYLYKEKQQTRQKSRRKIKNSTQDKAYSKRSKDPWLLATSLESHNEKKEAKKIINAYKKRMLIEHDFRDTKDVSWGVGLNNSGSYLKHRLEILLLIGYMALFLLWLIGLVGEKNHWQYNFQANSIKNKRVLSLVFLGLQMIKHNYVKRIKWLDIIEVVNDNRKYINETV